MGKTISGPLDQLSLIKTSVTVRCDYIGRFDLFVCGLYALEL